MHSTPIGRSWCACMDLQDLQPSAEGARAMSSGSNSRPYSGNVHWRARTHATPHAKTLELASLQLVAVAAAAVMVQPVQAWAVLPVRQHTTATWQCYEERLCGIPSIAESWLRLRLQLWYCSCQHETLRERVLTVRHAVEVDPPPVVWSGLVAQMMM